MISLALNPKETLHRSLTAATWGLAQAEAVLRGGAQELRAVHADGAAPDLPQDGYAFVPLDGS